MIGEVVFWVGVFPLPSAVDYRLGIGLGQGSATVVLALEIGDCPLQVNAPLLLEFADRVPAHLALEFNTG